MPRMRRKRAARGFSLIEVMIVIAIILAIMAIVGIQLFGRQEQAKVSLTEVDIKTIRNGMRLFRLDFGRWPTDEEGVRVLWDRDALDPEADESKWQKYLEEPLPRDRWGKEWGYRQVSDRDESEFDLWSFGPNGIDDDGLEDDITSWRRTDDDDGAFGGRAPPPPGR